ncbi:MAG: rRNA maturation RNase YbeY [Nitrospirales bacterium]|nr:rRNA maturation RNase YbeY [Nitrospirales bacterium]
MAVWLHSSLRQWQIRTRTLTVLTQAILRQAKHSTAHLSLSFVGHSRMRQLNNAYRNRDYATDVLAFPSVPLKGQEAPFLGDVVICLPTAWAQAATYGHTPDQELLRLLIHGILHLLGYDHERTPQEAKRMQRKEQSIFRQLSPVPTLIKKA